MANIHPIWLKNFWGGIPGLDIAHMTKNAVLLNRFSVRGGGRAVDGYFVSREAIMANFDRI
mgnify:CR=1 FL=1